MSEQIQAVYARGGKVVTEDGREKKLESAINPCEGKHLYDIVRMNGFTRTMEVGMANGLSSMFIAQVRHPGHLASGVVLRPSRYRPGVLT